MPPWKIRTTQMLVNNQDENDRRPTHACAKTIGMRSIYSTNLNQILCVRAYSFSWTQISNHLNANDTSQQLNNTKSMMQWSSDDVNKPEHNILHTPISRKRIVTQKGINYDNYHHIGSDVPLDAPYSINWQANPTPTHTSLNNLIIP